MGKFLSQDELDALADIKNLHTDGGHLRERHIQALDKLVDAERQTRMQYLGALNLLANISVHIHNDHKSDADEFRDNIEQALTDAQKFIPRLRWKRILDSFELDLADEDG